jgi:hypothetical protein
MKYLGFDDNLDSIIRAAPCLIVLLQWLYKGALLIDSALNLQIFLISAFASEYMCKAFNIQRVLGKFLVWFELSYTILVKHPIKFSVNNTNTDRIGFRIASTKGDIDIQKEEKVC